MNDSDGDPDFPPLNRRMADFAANPAAPRWAHDCGWMPGTGLCRNRPCSGECLFREQRETEANRLEHERRQRRRELRAYAERPRRLN